MQYDHRSRDAFWQQKWDEKRIFDWDPSSPGKKFYVLEMFPYTSGHLHIGHVRNYSMGDTLARMQIARGYSVLHPMGWDSFGLPAENAARKFGTHPAKFTQDAIDSMKRSMMQLGFGYSWANELATCSPTYILAQQKLFLDLYRKGLIYRDDTYVYWDPVEQTVLAAEQVIDGKGWRSGAAVYKRRTPQWFVDIRSYADRLLDDLESLEGWPTSVRNIQRNWIGRTEGAEVRFLVEASDLTINAFTTRLDTLAGCTFIALAPEHTILDELPIPSQMRASVKDYCESILVLSSEERSAGAKSGIFTGLMVVNPLNQERVPLYVANYVMPDFGTGAVIGVPAHDERDADFGALFGLPVRVVISTDSDATGLNIADGIVTNSHSLVDGLTSSAAREILIAHLSEKSEGQKSTQYRLQNWSISRQRYWGCPIPIIHCSGCGTIPVAEEQLPILLPDHLISEGSGSPLSRDESWMKAKCPQCGGDAARDPDTMDTFVDSSWYFLRYPSPSSPNPIDSSLCNKIAPADVYIGGIEHATLHLIYSRFITKVLHDLGYIEFDEPFVELYNQGMVNDVHGRKQSKSLGNVTDPSVVVQEFGADAVRCYLLFKTTYNAPINWEDSGPQAMRSYLERVCRLFTNNLDRLRSSSAIEICPDDCENEEDREIARQLQLAIGKVTADVERFHFNAAIAAIMSVTNLLYEKGGKASPTVLAGSLRLLVRLLAPFAPHISEELWALSGCNSLVAAEPWPTINERLVQAENIVLPVQINGKLIRTMTIPVNLAEEDILSTVLALPEVRSRLSDRDLKNYRYVTNRIINLVVG
ncbi:leucine--tRNA ligase (plasmid) [Agrobacterium tumefaciens]|uniref:Leucine--tRNA ligase n=1 Tax=Agrobacterium tumefaciens TaxID=358 RepID=A0AAE6EIF1_AGRTU|nr:leucine--tRNA ligase [Agrobacterium tumefaciens]QCL82907.1 leucine--tRNA ligase [Agrobacterium tumefaciens]